MATSMLHTDVSGEDVARLNRANGSEACKEALSEILLTGSSNHADDEDVLSIKVDFFFYLYAFAKRLKLHEAQMSTLLSIFKATIEHDERQPLCTMRSSFTFFKNRLLLHSCERPPWTVGIFSPEQVKVIVEFSLRSYYRHFRAYRTVLSKKPTIQLKQVLPGYVEEPMLTPRLSDMEEDMPGADEEKKQVFEEKEKKIDNEAENGGDVAATSGKAAEGAGVVGGEEDVEEAKSPFSEEDAALIASAIEAEVGKRRRELQKMKELNDMVRRIGEASSAV